MRYLCKSCRFSYITTNATLKVSSYKYHSSSHGVLKKKFCSCDFWCVDFWVVTHISMITKCWITMILTSLSYIHDFLKFQNRLVPAYHPYPDLTFCRQVQLIVTEHPSDCIINNDVRKLDISLSFLDKIGCDSLSPDVRPTWN